MSLWSLVFPAFLPINCKLFPDTQLISSWNRVIAMRTGAAEQGNEHHGLLELIWTLQSALPAPAQCTTLTSKSPHRNDELLETQLAPTVGTLCPYIDLNLPP